MNIAVPKIEIEDLTPTPRDTVQALATDTVYKAATFIETYTGRAFWPLHPSKEALSIIDIAHALSNQCRYSGHVRFFYSVAQHCCLLAKWLQENGGSAKDCLEILMHDAPEAYLVDIPRPVKQYMPQYRVWDHAINDVIRDWMNWSNAILPIQDELDSRVIVDERAQLMGNSGLDWGHNLKPLGIRIGRWTPEEAEKQFLLLYAAYSRQVYGSFQYINYDWNVMKTYIETSSDVAGVLDLMEVDVRGNVGKIKIRNADGIIEVDPDSGETPRPAWRWEHGKFQIMERGNK